MKSLHDLADTIGYEAIDREFMVWIESDVNLQDQVIQRIGECRPEVLATPRLRALADSANNVKQFMHRIKHPDGPYGWEFCGRGCK